MGGSCHNHDLSGNAVASLGETANFRNLVTSVFGVEGILVSGGADGSIRGWDLTTLQTVWKLDAGGEVADVTMYENKLIAAVKEFVVLPNQPTQKAYLRVWDVVTKQHICDLAITSARNTLSRIYGLAINNDKITVCSVEFIYFFNIGAKAKAKENSCSIS